MKPLTYNSPERAKERQSVVPPTEESINSALSIINHFVPSHYKVNYEVIQRLIDHYENLKHFHANAGGWQGLNNLQVNYEIVELK